MSRLEAFKREVLNLPNLITIGRLFLIPPVLVLIDPTDPIRNFLAALLFAVASGLDILDGFLARRQGQGVSLDPFRGKPVYQSGQMQRGDSFFRKLLWIKNASNLNCRNRVTRGSHRDDR